MKNNTYPTKNSWFGNWPGLLLLILSTLVIVVSLLELTGAIHLFHAQKVAVATTGGGGTKGVPKTAQQSETPSSSPASPSSTSTSQPASTTTPVNANTPLLAPSGTFANVYKATIDQQMGSTCSTTPGATCQIIFTNGTVTKILAAKTADSGGGVYWAWKPQEIGLYPGIWHILATTVLGPQNKSTSNDPLTLTITQ